MRSIWRKIWGFRTVTVPWVLLPVLVLAGHVWGIARMEQAQAAPKCFLCEKASPDIECHEACLWRAVQERGKAARLCTICEKPMPSQHPECLEADMMEKGPLYGTEEMP